MFPDPAARAVARENTANWSIFTGHQPFSIQDQVYQNIIDSRGWVDITPDEVRHVHCKTIQAFEKYAGMLDVVVGDNHQEYAMKLRDVCIDMSNSVCRG